MGTTTTQRRGLHVTDVLEPQDLVDDQVLRPGSLVWLSLPRLRDRELDLFRQAARIAATALHPAGSARLRVV